MAKRERDDDDEKPVKKSGGKSRGQELRDRWNNEDDDEGGDGGEWFKFPDGKTVIRPLPSLEEGEPFFIDYFQHWEMGPDGDQVLTCIEPDGAIGMSKRDKRKHAQKCPSCKRFLRGKKLSHKYPFGSEEGKKAWMREAKPWRARHSFAFRFTLPESDEPEKVHKTRVGVKVMQPLINLMYDDDGGLDFTDPKEGCNIIIKKKKLGGGDTNVEYDVKPERESSPVSGWKRIKKELGPLEELRPELLSVEEFEAILEGEPEDGPPRKSKKKRDDDDDDEDEKPAKRRSRDDDDDDDDRPVKKKSKKPVDDDDEDVDSDDEDDDDDGERKPPRPAKRRVVDDDDDVDVEADEDDDDEDDAPPKKKAKSKLEAKAGGKKKRPADDDDEDEEDD
jgi:hypothetical protein